MLPLYMYSLLFSQRLKVSCSVTSTSLWPDCPVSHWIPLSREFSRQERIPEWVAISISKGSSQPGDWTWVSCVADRLFTVWATREAPELKGPPNPGLKFSCSMQLPPLCHPHLQILANSFIPKSDFCLLSSARLYSVFLHYNLRSVSRQKTKAIRRLSLCFDHQLLLLSSKSIPLMLGPSLYNSFISFSRGSQSSAICCFMSKEGHLLYFPQFYSCLQ